MSIATLSLKDAMSLVENISLRMNEPVMLWGPPGVGKSDGINQLAEQTKALMVDIRLSQYDSVDMRGFPDVEGNQTVWRAPSTLPFKGNTVFDNYIGPIVLFLDEFTSAQPSVAAVAYQLVNDRRVGEHVLRDNVRIVAAGNRDGDKGITTRMALPLCNRLIHVEVEHSVDDWCQWAQKEKLSSVGIAFIQFRKPLLSTFDPSKPAKAYATPRTWEKALKFYDDTTMPDHIKHAAMVGAIGEGPASEFWGFVKVWQNVAGLMNKIKKNPKEAPLPEELSMRYAVIVSIAGLLTVKNIDHYSTYVERCDPDLVILAWQLASARDDALFTTDAFMRIAEKYRGIFQ